MISIKSILAVLVAGGLLVTGVSLAQQRLPQQSLPGHDAAAGEDKTALTPAGPLQGNWRVSRPGDPSDAAIMLVQLRQDGSLIEGDYVLYQPFCGLDLPPVQAGAETCEFDGVAAEVTGQVVDGQASVGFRPGADDLEHRLVFPASPADGPLQAVYLAPGTEAGLPILLTRVPD